MPVIVLERLGLPHLRYYTTVSVALLAFALYYAFENSVHSESTKENASPDISGANIGDTTISPLSDSFGDRLINILVQDAWITWILVNAGCCGLVLLCLLIQKVVFGELRISEQQHVKDAFWNFVFYKFIFVFGVMNVQNMDEVVLWCAWFSVLCFLHLLTQLSKDRFEYLSFSPMIPWWNHVKVVIVLIIVQVSCLLLFAISLYVWLSGAVAVSIFMIAEVTLLTMKSLYVIMRFLIHLWDTHYDGTWENRAMYVYYVELVFDLMVLSVDFAHHLHMLLWGNVFLSMASLVICMQLRYFFYEFQRRYRRHKNYLRVISLMEARFPPASNEDLMRADENCAICWEKMETARRLPCGHMFHMACLRSWLEQDTSCPTCRMSLGNENSRNNPPPNVGIAAHIGAPAGLGVFRQAMMANQHSLTNHFFHFDGSRYVSWLPSVSVEVTHTTNLLGGRLQPIDTSQLNSMTLQVQEVFPNIPRSLIIDDLRLTRSVELTLENIVEGRVSVPESLNRTQSDLQNEGTASAGDTSAVASSEVRPVSENSTSGSGDFEPAATIATSASRSSSATAASAISSVSSSASFLSAGSRMPEDDELARIGTSAALSTRFSKSPTERESMLRSRKDMLLQKARKRYLHKSIQETEGQNAPNM